MATKKAAKRTKASNVKGNGTSRWSGVVLPSGYQAIANQDRGMKWDFETHPVLEGEVLGIRTVGVGTGRNKRESQVMNIRTKQGEVFSLWESASLEEFFKTAEAGMECAVAFSGYQDIGRPQPMKMFSAGLKEGQHAKKATASKSARKS